MADALIIRAAEADEHPFYERIGFERHGYSFRLNLLRGAA
jgi:hypothetical protein